MRPILRALEIGICLVLQCREYAKAIPELIYIEIAGITFLFYYSLSSLQYYRPKHDYRNKHHIA